MADGTAASDTADRPGTATAVFDVTVSGGHTVQSYRERLLGRVSRLQQEETEVGGQRVVFIDYEGDDFAGRQQVAIVPAYGVLFVYRAAFPHDDAAFGKGLPAFRRAVRSMTFKDPP